MKRPNTLTLLSIAILTILLGLAIFTPRANATRSMGFEAGDIAFVDVFTLIDRALSADTLAQERLDFETESNASMSQMQQQLMTLQGQLGAIQPDDPSAGQLDQQYQQVQSNLQRASQQASADYQSLIAEQISQAYGEIYAGTNTVAAELGYAFVFATRSNGELIQTDTINGITQEILARPLVTPPTGVDITEAVRVKLGYPEEAAADLEIGTEPADDVMTEQDETPTADPMGSDEE